MLQATNSSVVGSIISANIPVSALGGTPIVIGTIVTQMTPITGIIREVNGNILSGVAITLDGTSTVASD